MAPSNFAKNIGISWFCLVCFAVLFLLLKKEIGSRVCVCACVVFIISELSLHSVLKKHKGLGPEVIEVSGIVSSEDNKRNQIVGHKKVGKNKLFSSGTISFPRIFISSSAASIITS